MSPPRFDIVARSLAAATMLLSISAACTAAAPPFDTAQGKPEVRATSDVFSAPGVALAWGMLRASGDTPPVVDVRIAVDPMTYPRVAVVGRNSSSARERVLATSPTAGLTDIRVARASFERYPRTEFRFFATAASEPSEEPKLVVYFVGVPATTPEFANEARLDASLTERIVRARSAPATRAQ